MDFQIEEQLLVEIRRHPVLYDQSLQDFKDNEIKSTIWGEIARKIFGKDDFDTVEKLKVRWKSMRDGFVRSLRKRTNTRKLRNSYRPYRFEKEMKFLIPHLENKTLNDVVNGTADEDESCPQTEKAPEKKVSVKESTRQVIQETPIHHQTVAQRRKRKKPEQYAPADPVIFPGQAMGLDPVDSFFSALAQTVKQLRPTTVARVKKAVANIVIDAELKELKEKEEQQEMSFMAAQYPSILSSNDSSPDETPSTSTVLPD